MSINLKDVIGGSQREQRRRLEQKLRDARSRVMRAIDGLDERGLLEPGVCGAWSARDLLVHLSAWDRATAEAIRSVVGKRPAPFLNLGARAQERFNATSQEAAEGTAIDDVRAEFEAARADLLAAAARAQGFALFVPVPDVKGESMTLADALDIIARHDEEHAHELERHARVWARRADPGR